MPNLAAKIRAKLRPTYTAPYIGVDPGRVIEGETVRKEIEGG